MRKRASAVLMLCFLCAGACGDAKPPKPAMGPRASADAGPSPAEPPKTPEAAPKPAAPAAAAQVHPCAKPAANARDAWDRIQLARELDEEERERSCELDLVEVVAPWRAVPQDLLLPAVERAAADRAGLDAWIAGKARTAPEAVLQVVAMDISRAFTAGGNPAVVPAASEGWAARLAELGVTTDLTLVGLDKVLAGAAALVPILAEVNEIHRLRCLLEVNPLGFAVACTPIHPSGTPITLRWRTVTRDGLLEDLILERCSGKSCAKIESTAAKLLADYLSLVRGLDELEVKVYADRVKELLVLPPFHAFGQE